MTWSLGLCKCPNHNLRPGLRPKNLIRCRLIQGLYNKLYSFGAVKLRNNIRAETRPRSCCNSRTDCFFSTKPPCLLSTPCSSYNWRAFLCRCCVRVFMICIRDCCQLRRDVWVTAAIVTVSTSDRHRESASPVSTKR